MKIDQDALNLTKAMRQVESGGDPNAVGDKGTSTGAYQWQKGNYEAMAKKFGIDPTDRSLPTQNKVAYMQVKEWKDKGATPDQIAAAWNMGERTIGNDMWKTHKGFNKELGISYDTPAHVAKVKSEYMKLKGVQGQPTGQVKIDTSSLPRVSTPEELMGKDIIDREKHPVIGAIADFPVNVVKGLAKSTVGNIAQLGLGGLAATGVMPEEEIKNAPAGLMPVGYDAQGNKLSTKDTLVQGTGKALEAGGTIASLMAGGAGVAGPALAQSGAKATLGTIGRGMIAGTPQMGVAGVGSYLGDNPTESFGDLAKGGSLRGLEYAGLNAVAGGIGAGASKALMGILGKKTTSQAIDDLINAGDYEAAGRLMDSPEGKALMKQSGINSADDAIRINNDTKTEIRKQANEALASKPEKQASVSKVLNDDALDDTLTYLSTNKPKVTNGKFDIQDAYNAAIKDQEQAVGQMQALVKGLDEAGVDISMSKTQLLDAVEKKLDDIAQKNTDINKETAKKWVLNRIENSTKKERVTLQEQDTLRRGANKNYADTDYSTKEAGDRALADVIRDYHQTIIEKGLANNAIESRVLKSYKELNNVWRRAENAKNAMTVISKTTKAPKGGAFVPEITAGIVSGGYNPLVYWVTQGLAHKVLGSVHNVKLLNKYTTGQGKFLPSEIRAAFKNAEDVAVELAGKVSQHAEDTAKIKAVAEYNKKRDTAVAKLMETLNPKMGEIQMGPKAVSKYKKANPDLPSIQTKDLKPPKVAGELPPDSYRQEAYIPDDKLPTIRGFAGQKELGIIALLSPLGVASFNKLSSLGKETYIKENMPEDVQKIAEASNQPEQKVIKQLAKIASNSDGKPKVDTASNTEYTINGRTAKVREKDLEELGAIIYGEISNRNPEKQLLEARTIANIVLNRMENHEWRGKSVADIVLEHKKGAKYPAFQAKDGKQFRDYKNGTPRDTSKLKAINEVINEIRKGELKNNIDDYLMYAHMPDDSIRAFKDWKHLSQNLNKIKKL